jgi:TolB-like protein/Tfp pilus assembly protein PilF
MESQAVRFDDYEVDLGTRELRKAGVRVRLQEQPFQILAMLLARRGGVVTRDEIRDRLWPDGTFVDFEHSVNAAIKRLRAALGDTAGSPRYVETLPRRGYRFVAPVTGAENEKTSSKEQHAAPPEHRRRLVVLPFTNLSGDAQDYFSDGLTEEMIAQVGRRCANHIGVLARTSSMLYKNVARAAGDIGEALHADYLVEGSVRRDGDRVRITAQLIETRSETHLWADSYDRDLADCLAVQTDVASQIAHALTLELLPRQATAVSGTRDAAAYQAFLRGRFHWNKAGAAGLDEAIAYYDQALSLDPGFGGAYSARARARVSLCDYHMVDPREALEKARADAKRALELDPSDSEAHVAMGEVARVLDWNWPGAEASYRAALAANPNSEAACRYYGLFLVARGRAQATAMADRACDLDPLCLVVNTAAASVDYFRGDFEAALARCRHTLTLNPTFGIARRRMAATLAALGRHTQALEEFELVSPTRLDPVSRAWMGHTLAVSGNRAAAIALANSLVHPADGSRVPSYDLAILYTALGDTDAAFRHLTRAFESRDTALDTMNVEPRFAPLRGDGRFLGMVERLGLAASTVLAAT